MWKFLLLTIISDFDGKLSFEKKGHSVIIEDLFFEGEVNVSPAKKP